MFVYYFVDVLQWDFDFMCDLCVGDFFCIVYESVYVEGEFVCIGQVFVVLYVNWD